MIDQLRALFRQLSTAQKIWISGAAAGSLVLLFVFVSIAGQPDYQPAFTKLSPTVAGQISESLRTAKIPFQMADAGATILVASSRLADARVAAAQAGGLTNGSQGFELFDKGGFGMSEFDQQVMYQRAIQGELERTIGAMAGVSDVRVTVVPSKKGLFTDQDTAASASVMLQMQGGQQPNAAMVRGITTTVAAAVAGLTPDGVTVVDQQGRVLSGSQDAATVGALAVQTTVERNAESQVLSLIDKALGPGHASVTVAATMDTEKVEKQITTYTPIDQAGWTPVSVHTVQETYGGSGTPGSGGIPGSVSNVPGLPTYPGNIPAAPSPAPGASASPAASATPAPSPTPTPNGYVKREETVNYNLSQTVEHIVQEPGVVKRLSVAVLVDQKAIGTMTPETLTKSISAAIGADTTRGDVVSVTAVAFAVAETPVAQDDMMGQLLGYARNAAGVLVAFVLLFFVWRNMRALRRRAEDAELLAVPAGSAAVFASYGASGSPAQLAAPEPLPEQSGHSQIQDRLRLVADQRPESLVNLMNAWLLDDQKKRR
jgi:flagellar M-ring protein FliF